jgi:rhamnosyltransferase subunit B
MAECPLRVLLCPFGSEGDINPMLWAARALQNAGHDPHLLVTANYGRLARQAGIPWTPVGQPADFEQVIRDRKFWHPFAGPLHVARVMAASLPEFHAGYLACGARPERVVVSTFGLAAAFAAEAGGIPCAHMHMQPVVLRGHDESPLMAHGTEWLCHSPRVIRRIAHILTDWVVDAALRGPLNRFRRCLGLPPLANVYREAVMGGDGIALMVPSWFAPWQTGWPSRLVQFGFPFEEGNPRAISGVINDFIKAHGAPVLWTHGSANFDTAGFWECAVHASMRNGVPGLLVGREPPRRPMPATCLHVVEVPFEDVFPVCRAVVHHGGIGTTAKAIAAGVPQLVVPRAHDQPDNAWRVERLGLGLRLPYPLLHKSRITARLRKLLGSTPIRDACTQHAGTVNAAANGPEFVRWITGLSPVRP